VFVEAAAMNPARIKTVDRAPSQFASHSPQLNLYIRSPNVAFPKAVEIRRCMKPDPDQSIS
jgi:hypothetical protein